MQEMDEEVVCEKTKTQETDEVVSEKTKKEEFEEEAMCEASEASPDSSDDDCDVDVQENNGGPETLFTDCPSLCKTSAMNQYILHIDGTLEFSPNIAVALSDYTCEVYHLTETNLAKIATLSEHKDKISEVRFCKFNSNLVYTASNDGTIRVWDLRSPQSSKYKYIDDTTLPGSKNRSIECFDISADKRLISAGTSEYESDAYLIFWDLRKHKLLGGYWESHEKDITQVKFHPECTSKLMSGSEDGLINIYDLTQSEENNALQDSLNTNCSVERISWNHHNGKEVVSSLVSINEVQVWREEDVRPYLHFRRPDVASALKRKSETYTYTVNVHETSREQLFLLAGSNFGDGQCLRTVKLDNVLRPGFSFSENEQRVRCSWFNKDTNLLVTGGEKGILNAWKLDFKSDMY